MTKIYNLVPGSALVLEKTNGYSSLIVTEPLNFFEHNLVKKEKDYFHFRHNDVNYYVQPNSICETFG